ncbi:hypothetical protein [Desertimonas flava]|jgi:hypothetical protein|uniref:hypothetical protein n=1 Tax=Desertimonas flava TaxID=2064846 RepID=UPI0013C51E56|nr:hypothetical protein [Desertimonas flava]
MPSLPKFEMPFELPFELPKVAFPKVDLFSLDLAKLDLPEIDVLAIARGAAYAGTGLVALTAERAGELQAAFTAVLTEIVTTQRSRVASLAEPVVATVKAAVTR